MRISTLAAVLALTTTLAAQERRLASFDFASGLDSAPPDHGWATVSPVSANGPTGVQFGRLCVLHTWPDTGGHIEFTLNPGPATLELDRLFVEYIGSETPTINHIRVTSSLDGHASTLFERVEDMNDFIGNFTVDLSLIAAMQDVSAPVTFRVSFERTAGWSSPDHYELDGVVLYGDDKPPASGCVGTGGASLQIISPTNAIIDAGSACEIRLRGTPDALHAIVFDPERGALDLFPFGELCTTLSPSSVVIPGVFPPNGQVDHLVNWPAAPGTYGEELCFLLIDIPTLAIEDIQVSNRVCVKPGARCEDKIEQLQLMSTVAYPGPYPTTVTVEARKTDQNGDLIGSATVSLDADGTASGPATTDGAVTIETLSIFGGDVSALFRIDAATFEDGDLPNDTWVQTIVGGVSVTQEIQTSCSNDFGTGFVFGDFVVTEMLDRSRFDQCVDGRKPGILRLTYTGDGCEVTSHAQDADKVHCAGDPDDMPLVFVRASNKSDPNDGGAKVWFQGPVHLFESFELHATDEGQNDFGSKVYVHVLDAPGGTVLQQVDFHTSCSQPMRIGDRYGALRLTAFADLDDDDECQYGPKPALLTMRYDGWDCSKTRHGQDPSKVDCTGDTAHTVSVYIRATDKENPDDSGALIWFQDWVPLGSVFDVDSANAGETKLKSTTHIHVFTAPGGTLLQHVEFHTSCSQRLRAVDQYGALRLLDFVPE